MKKIIIISAKITYPGPGLESNVEPDLGRVR